MKKILACSVIVPLLVVFMGVPVFAQQGAPVAPPQSSVTVEPPSATSAWNAATSEKEPSQPPGDLILADLLVLRPLGVVACGLGVVGSVLALPFTAMTHSCPEVTNALLVKPFDYTFKRKLGDVDY